MTKCLLKNEAAVHPKRFGEMELKHAIDGNLALVRLLYKKKCLPFIKHNKPLNE